MRKTTTSIICYIPQFLDHCNETGLSGNTQENYRRFLNKFIIWLKENNKTNLLPHELTINDISDYKTYLSSYKDEKNHPLKQVTQNYYLIALRALLSYFTAKDIECMPSAQIGLPGAFRAENRPKSLNLEQIQEFLAVPDIKTPIGLRDRVIFEMLMSTGLRIRQLISLNKDQLENIVSGEILPLLTKYLRGRDDKDKALFIHYNSRKNVENRLTPRTVEKIVQRYGKKANLPYLITPETLRWARIHTLLDRPIKIERILTHNTSVVKNYKYSTNGCGKVNNELSPTWQNIENEINSEIVWLKNNIPILPDGFKNNPLFLKCDDCILRKLAILIVSGEVTVTEFVAQDGKSLWTFPTEKYDIVGKSRHGQELHKKIMDIAHNYFESENYKVVSEPILNYGRADLGVSVSPRKNIYVEVGTISLFKLWYNLSMMKNQTFLIIPSEDYAIEFNV